MPPHAVPQIAVIGASLGGVLAAHSAATAGASVTLVAAPGWIGGQLTAQGVPPDEHKLIEQGGASRSYRDWRERMRAHYRAQPGFRDKAAMTPGTNPGDGWVSRLCVEPAVAAADLEALLAPHLASGKLTLIRDAHATAVERHGRLITAVQLSNGQRLQARLFLDATDTGDLLPLAGLPWRVGKEARHEFGEALAPEVADPLDQQPITAVIALKRQATPGPVWPAPPAYAFWRSHVLPGYGHRQFSHFLPGHGEPRSQPFVFFARQEADATLDLWRYRRIVAAHQWAAPVDDISLVNWAQNDYALHPLLDGPRPQAEVEAAARELSLCLLHWLQTEAGFPELQPAPEVFGTADGLAPQVYVRESRRIVPLRTLRAQTLGQVHDDSVGLAWYAMDMHPTCVSGQGLNASVPPFELPLSCFIPQHCDNLLPACKNLGVTHLVNACTRVHPGEWLIGEVAGLIAAQALARGLTPAAIHESPAERAALQALLTDHGIPLHWGHELLSKV